MQPAAIQPAAIQDATLPPALLNVPGAQVSGKGAPGFAESLTSTLAQSEDDKAAKNEAEAREAAQQLVASAFLKPMLKQMRESEFKTKYFSGGPGEDAFKQQLHMRLADQMSQRMDLPIVDAVTRFVTRQADGAADSAAGSRVDQRG